MTWPFCGNCGTVLDPPVGSNITCDFCGHTCSFAEVNVGEIITYSAVRSKPAWIDDDDEQTEHELSQSKQGSSLQQPSSKKTTSKHATIEEPCPKCGNHELYFYTMQLRSVDEGSTVFYECPRCSHKFSVNN
jgi:DNA-directed RNA polymerase I subunit RPA12